jgi:EmrB/QacA subfamily drug resistance transporter
MGRALLSQLSQRDEHGPRGPADRRDGDSPPVPHGATDRRSPHAALYAVIVATFLLTLDSSTVNVALPHVRREFGVGSEVTWVVTAYLLASMVSMPASGWIAAKWGTRRTFLVTIVGFAVGSLVVAASPNLSSMIGARAFVGIVSAPMIPVSMTIVTRVYPPERRGWAIAMWSIAAVIGPALGPSVGGKVADDLSWRWVFLGIPPLAVVALFLAWRAIPDVDPRDPSARLDTVGFALGPPGLCLLILALSRGRIWGWTSPVTIGAVILGAGLLIAFVRRCLRVVAPLLDISLVRVPRFLLGSSLTALAGGTMIARVVFVPLELADVRGYSTTHIGLLFLPIAAATAVGMACSGRVVDRRGPRAPLIAGAILLAIGSLLISQWGPHTSTGVIIGSMLVHGIGQGLYLGPTVVVALSKVPMSRIAQASTLRQLFQQLGSVVVSALLGTVLAAHRDGAQGLFAVQQAYEIVFFVAAAVAVLLLVLTLRIPRGRMH